MFESLNKSFESPFIDSEMYNEAEFISCEQLHKLVGADKINLVKGCWINSKSKFGEHPVLMIVAEVEKENLLFNLSCPQNLTPTIKAILECPELVQGINEGKCGVRVYQYHAKKYNKDCYGVKFVDL